MKTHRLTSVTHILHFWDFIEESLKTVSQASREPFDSEKVKKTLFMLVSEPDHAWVGLTMDDYNIPIAFAVSQECTPEFDSNRSFVVRWFYHTPSRFDATLALMGEFESWAKANSIKTYAVTTRRSAGRAIQCFSSAKYGFKKAFLTFEKDL
jgi:hypothetical protein